MKEMMREIVVAALIGAVSAWLVAQVITRCGP